MHGGSTPRNLVFADMNLSNGFGPEERGTTSCTLFLVMCNGELYKDRLTADKQVACWHHHQYILYSVFSLSMWVLWSLCMDCRTPHISFLHVKKKECCPWCWDQSIMDWNQYSDARSAMHHIYRAKGVINCK
jgi:hypothetical protein